MCTAATCITRCEAVNVHCSDVHYQMRGGECAVFRSGGLEAARILHSMGSPLLSWQLTSPFALPAQHCTINITYFKYLLCRCGGGYLFSLLRTLCVSRCVCPQQILVVAHSRSWHGTEQVLAVAQGRSWWWPTAGAGGSPGQVLVVAQGRSWWWPRAGPGCGPGQVLVAAQGRSWWLPRAGPGGDPG